MNYETASKMAERVGVTTRLVQLWAKQGKLPGAMKQGRDWLIPLGMTKPKRGMPVQNGYDISLPLLSGGFEPGTIYSTIMEMEDGDEKNIALAEYYYFTGAHQKAVEETEKFFNHKDVVTKVSACLIYAFANIALGEEKLAKLGFKCIEEALDVEIDKDHISPQQKAICMLLGATVNVLMHRKPPEAELSKYMKYLPRGLQVWACCMLAQIAFLQGNYDRAIGIAETILSVSQKTYPVSYIYIYITIAMSYMELKKIEDAKKYLNIAWEYGKKEGFIQPFGEYHSLLCGLVEICIKKENPSEYEEIMRVANSFIKNWRNVHNNVSNSKITTSLTTSEFAISMLASRGWSNQEIADYMGLSLHTVKRYISIVYQKLAITSRAELKDYMH